MAPYADRGSDLSNILTPEEMGQASQALAPKYDAARGLNYTVVDGKKYYQPPGGNPLAGEGANGGGWFHGHTVWNPEEGRYTSAISWGKVAAWVGLGIVGYGAASAMVGTGAVAGAPAAASTGATGATGAVGAGVGTTGALASSTTVPLASALPVAASTSGLVGGTAAGVGAGVAGAGAGVAGGGAAAAPTTASGVLGGYGSLISQGVGVGANLIGARMQANASRDAAEIQDKYLREALAYEKEKDAYERQRQAEQTGYDRTWKEGQYADIVSRMNPYIIAGGNAADRQARLLGLPTSPSPNQAPLTSGRVGAPTTGGSPYTGGSVAGAASAAGGGPTINPPPSGPMLPVPGQGLPVGAGVPIPSSSPSTVGGQVQPGGIQYIPPNPDAFQPRDPSGVASWSADGSVRRPDGSLPPKPGPTGGVIDYGGGRTSGNDGWTRNPDGSYGTGYADTHPNESPFRQVVPAAPAMVLLQSPSGTQKQVPADQVDYWIQKGATRV